MLTKLILAIMPKLPQSFIWKFSKKYIVGKTLDKALEVSKSMNDDGYIITIDLLGEFIKDRSEAEQTKEDYLEIVEALHKHNIKGGISVKPTFFGLLIDEELCFTNIREVVRKANEYNIFVRIDMEDSSCTDRELEIYEKLHVEFPGIVGIVLQAYLHRTYDDIERLQKIHTTENPINIRLCKGIYIEDKSIAYQSYEDINNNFIKLLDKLFEIRAYVGIATHDKNLVKAAYELLEKHEVSKSLYEFQMLYGVETRLRKRIHNQGHLMKVYLPFGKDWFGYCVRRLQENPNMVSDIIKSIFK
ncbi:L-proline dehydrogenase [Balneicella halophila]|uniref:proline dehydrogenase n=1 Tax=Balneicella halophila TaxID=1537566 RepID=A0A7L4UN55_BALHA|nr:proline dehydrogenase family protein [Balneicella halophila]PVX49905.1 L-proline dehydrogenase [Balneicella halophila]